MNDIPHINIAQLELFHKTQYETFGKYCTCTHTYLYEMNIMWFVSSSHLNRLIPLINSSPITKLFSKYHMPKPYKTFEIK